MRRRRRRRRSFIKSKIGRGKPTCCRVARGGEYAGQRSGVGGRAPAPQLHTRDLLHCGLQEIREEEWKESGVYLPF